MPSIRWGLGTGADLCVPFSGNATLSGCRIIGAGLEDDDVVLDWNTHPVDGAAICHVLGNEGSGNAADAVNGHNIVPGSWSASGTGWFGDYAVQNSWVAASTVPQLDVTQDFTFEFWVYRNVQTPADLREFNFLNAGVNLATILVDEYTASGGSSRVRWFLRERTGEIVSRLVTVPTFTAGTWHHVGYERHSGNGYCYIDGQVVDGPVSVARLDTAAAMTVWRANTSSGQTRRWNDLYLTQAAIHGGASYATGRYKSAAQNGGVQPYAQCSQAGLTGMVPAAVSWSATTGAGYGQVKRVLVNDVSAGWTAVGGAYPTSPVAISGLVLASEDAVRVELEPKADTLQSETPVLDWLHLEYTLPVTGGRVYRPTPVRLGPKLLPIGVLA